MAKASSKLHVAMLPWSAFGHMIPFYQLSIALAKRGVRVSYISTSRNIDRLPEIPCELVPFMQYVSLPLAEVPGLPNGAEATVDLEFDEIPYLKVAYDLLHKPLKDFVSRHSPGWVISDFAAHWLPEITEEHQVQLMIFSVYAATSLVFFGPPEYLTGEGREKVRPAPESLERPPDWGTIFPPSVAFRGYEAAKAYPGFYNSNASGITDGERMARSIRGCRAVGVRSCSEFEGEYIELYQNLLQIPVLPVGLLPPSKIGEEENKDGPWTEAMKWLDQQHPQSVIYVGFGSEYKLTKDEVYEIAYGLELAQLPFLWALRRPTWASDDSEALPPGFLSRTSGKGVVCLGWAPQLKILAHPSVGGSLFHSGWGSIIETLQHGHNLILLPFIADQGLNARVMVDKGLGIEVERREDGSYSRGDIAYALRRAMVGNEAEKIRTRGRKAATIFGDQKLQEEHYIREFVKYLTNAARYQ